MSGEVVLARPSALSIGSSVATSAPGLARDRLGLLRGDERLDEDRRDAVARARIGDALQILRARLRLGRVARDRNLVQVVRLAR